MASGPSSSCCNIDPDSVSQSTRASWCQANLNTCSEICGGQGSTPENSCDPNTLQYTCKCTNGTEPDLSEYAQTVPSFECRQWQSDCIAGGLSESTCTATKCGDKVTGAEDSSSASKSASLSPSPSRSTSESRSKELSLSTRTSSSTSTRTSSSPGGGNDTTLTTSSEPTTPPAAQTTGPSNTSTTNTSTSLPPSTFPGLSPGAKAGAAIGPLLMIVLLIFLLFYIRRRKHKAKALRAVPREPQVPSDEKQLAIPIAEEISQKPELDNNVPAGRRADVPELDGRLYHNGDLGVYGAGGHFAELPSATRALEMDAGVSSIGDTRTLVEERTRDVSVSASASPASTRAVVQAQSNTEPVTVPDPEPRPLSPAPTTRSVKPLSAEEIEALEEEERRLDVEMAEVQRMKELREQKFAIQQKLREAKRR